MGWIIPDELQCRRVMKEYPARTESAYSGFHATTGHASPRFRHDHLPAQGSRSGLGPRSGQFQNTRLPGLIVRKHAAGQDRFKDMVEHHAGVTFSPPGSEI